MKIMDRLRNLRDHLVKAREQMSSNDVVSWITHWMICWFSTLVLWGLVNQFWAYLPAVVMGKLLAEFWLVFFGHREGRNLVEHRVAGHDMKRYTKDGMGDLAGAVLCDVVWWLVLWSAMMGA